MAPPSPVPTPAELLERALRADPSRALVTFYDDATGERAELSVATFANWVAKTANFIRDGLGLDVGDRVAIALPCHWQALVWWQACWTSGLVVVVPVGGSGAPGSSGAAAGGAGVPVAALVRATVWPPDVPGEPGPRSAEVVALGLGPMGLPVPGAALAGAVDHDREIHSHGDRFPAPPGLGARTPALESPGGVHDAGDLSGQAVEAVARWGLASGERVLTTQPLTSARDAVAALLAPLLAGSGVVLVRHAEQASDDTLARRVTDEGVTAVLAEPGSGSRLPLSEVRPLD